MPEVSSPARPRAVGSERASTLGLQRSPREVRLREGRGGVGGSEGAKVWEVPLTLVGWVVFLRFAEKCGMFPLVWLLCLCLF